MAASVRSRIQQGLVLACVVLGIVSTAWGSPVWVQVAGEVTQSDFATIGVGSLVTGFYAYDDSLVPDVDVHPHGILANYSPVGMRLRFVDGSSIGSDAGLLFVNNHSLGDEYGVFIDASHGLGTWTGAFVGPDWDYAIAAILRHDPTAAAWDDIILPDPETILDRLPIDSSNVYFFEESYGVSGSIHFKVTDLSVVSAPVPVPGALALGAIGWGCCHRLLRRRSR
jgi:hypothetical protein